MDCGIALLDGKTYRKMREKMSGEMFLLWRNRPQKPYLQASVRGGGSTRVNRTLYRACRAQRKGVCVCGYIQNRISNIDVLGNESRKNSRDSREGAKARRKQPKERKENSDVFIGCLALR